jgi:hypothetical protein
MAMLEYHAMLRDVRPIPSASFGMAMKPTLAINVGVSASLMLRAMARANLLQGRTIAVSLTGVAINAATYRRRRLCSHHCY